MIVQTLCLTVALAVPSLRDEQPPRTSARAIELEREILDLTFQAHKERREYQVEEKSPAWRPALSLPRLAGF